jgi:DNA repair protein RadD
MTYQLRDYQLECKEGVRREFRAGHKSVLVVMPTGGGKTLTLSDMVGDSYRKGKRILWLVDREELADQASETFRVAGVPHSYVMAGEEPDRFGRAWVGMIQSYLARKRQEKWLPERVDLIVVDEAHRTESASYKAMLADFPDAYQVGLTATPLRGDGRGLGHTYNGLVQPVTTLGLIQQGYLVPPRYFIPSDLDYSAVAAKKGEYNNKDLEVLAQSNPQLVGDVVENFARTCPDRRAVVFPMTIAQSLGLRDAFNSAGIPAVHIDGDLKKAERRERMNAFRSGEYQVLTSVNIAIEGLDVPDVSAVIIARPTKSLRIYIQAVGRGLRAFPGQTDCIVLDHAGVVSRFGPAEDYQDWTLDTKTGRKASKSSCQSRDPKEITCEECGEVFFSERVCPACSHEHEFERAPRHLTVVEGELEELTIGGRKVFAYTEEDQRRWWGELQGYVRNKSKNPGMAFHLFTEKFGFKPGSWSVSVPAAQPSTEVLAWCKHRQIAFAKKKEADTRNAAD